MLPDPEKPAMGRVGDALIAGIATCVVVATAFLYNRWMLDPRTFFFADDWNWIGDAEFNPWGFAILPYLAYNDRPVAVWLLRTLYHVVGLNHKAFQVTLLAIHAFNCVVLYAIARRYTGTAGALVAALLSAVWFAANTAVSWSAGLFDLLGAMLCLLTVLFRQRAVASGNWMVYDVLGAVCYYLAVRTKEYALGTIALLFVLNLLVERQTLRATMRQLGPYLLVFFVLAWRYGQLLAVAAPSSGTPYHLDLSPLSVMENLGYYLRELFFANTVASLYVPAGVILAMGVGALASDDKAQRTIAFGFAGFVAMLGPTLLLTGHKYSLYLYAAHLFFALMIGALVTRRLIPLVAGIVASATVAATPIVTKVEFFSVGYQLGTGERDQSMLNSAIKVLTPMTPGTAVFLSGLEPFYNPFAIQRGFSLKVAFKTRDIRVELEEPDSELIPKFCATKDPRKFLRFIDSKAIDVTAEIANSCRERKLG